MTRLQWLGAVLGLLAATATAGPDESCSLSVGWEPYGNYIFVNEDGEVDGVDIDLMKIVAKEIGCEVIFEAIAMDPPVTGNGGRSYRRRDQRPQIARSRGL